MNLFSATCSRTQRSHPTNQQKELNERDQPSRIRDSNVKSDDSSTQNTGSEQTSLSQAAAKSSQYYESTGISPNTSTTDENSDRSKIPIDKRKALLRRDTPARGLFANKTTDHPIDDNTDNVEIIDNNEESISPTASQCDSQADFFRMLDEKIAQGAKNLSSSCSDIESLR